MTQHLDNARDVYNALRFDDPARTLLGDVWLRGGHYFNGLRINHFSPEALLVTQGDTPIHIDREAIVAIVVRQRL